ncbi:MAG: glycerophosphodiester phosphodiesterase [Rhodothermales bacterium]|nr:glycerophosphodiester phosphodiesterase [Rhodothermales bacterium]
MPDNRKYVFDLQGHRGARGLLPENTVPAFLLALEIGVTTLELDVVISKDNKVVVSHDPWFNPLVTEPPSGETAAMDYGDLKLYDLPYSEIRRFNVGARRHPMFSKQVPIPTYKPLLAEVIQHAESFCAAHGRTLPGYNVETKSNPEGDGVLHPGPEEFASLLTGCLIEHGVEERATIQSFDVRTLIAARGAGTKCKLSCLISGSDPVESGEEVVSGVEKALGFLPEIISPSYKIVTHDLVEAARLAGIEILPWTVNTVEEMYALLEMGVAGLITDYPDIGITILDRK